MKYMAGIEIVTHIHPIYLFFVNDIELFFQAKVASTVLKMELYQDFIYAYDSCKCECRPSAQFQSLKNNNLIIS